MIDNTAIREGEYYSTGSSILKVHKIHPTKNTECKVDVTIFSPNGTSVYSQAMPIRMFRKLIHMEAHLVEVLFS